jgi:hypothetical protein
MRYILALLALIVIGVSTNKAMPRVQDARILESPSQTQEIAVEPTISPAPVEKARTEAPVASPAIPPVVEKPAPVTKIVPSGSCEVEIAKYDWNQVTARAIMLKESGGNPGNHNYNPKTKDDSWGCFQVNIWGKNARTRPPAGELVKAEVNVRYAYNLQKAVGWCSKGGWLNSSKKIGICK